MAKLMVAFRNFANSPKKKKEHYGDALYFLSM